jgi:hypothetical protein
MMQAYLEDLSTLLQQIERGELALPDFQRDFDWTEREVEELLVTVLSDWPAGSLLLMARGSEFFNVRRFEHGPDALDYRRLVLDGQQRLTSLYHACLDRGPAVYAVLLDEFRPDGDIEQAVASFDRIEWMKQSRTPVDQYLARRCPFSTLVTSSAFFRWRDSVVDALQLGDREAARDELSQLYSRVFRSVERYRFPVVVYESDLEPASVARIFERVNRTGQRLSTWDLMVAKLYRPGWNLRDQWDIVQASDEAVRRICSKEGLPLLEAMALRYSLDVRQAAVLRLVAELVHDQWEDFVAAMSSTARFLQSLGMGDSDELPYAVFRTIVCATAVAGELEQQRPFLSKWIWSRTFSAHFESAANTRAVADYRALLQSDAAPVPDSVSFLRLTQATRRSSRALWLGFQAWIRSHAPEQPSEGPHDELLAFSLLEDFGASLTPALETPYRQRVLALALGPRWFVGMVKKLGLEEALARLDPVASRWTADQWLDLNGLPHDPGSRRSLLANPAELIRHRFRWLAQSLSDLGISIESTETSAWRG